MNREEAANWLEHYCYGNTNILRDCDDDIAEKIQTAMDEAIAALRGPQPDPTTGLAPCGCGGKAGFHYSVMLRDNDCYVECGICGGHTRVALSEDRARDAWNTAMGYKGQ